MNTAAADTTDLLDEHQEWLQQVIARRVGNADAVAEVMSEVALAFVKSNKIPEASAEMAPWLCKIAIRQSALYLRKQSRGRKLVESYAQQAEAEKGSMEDPIYWLLNQERHDILRSALAELDTQDQEILMMKYQQKLTYQKMGKQLGAAPHVAEYRLAQAKKRLRKVLIERGLGEEDLA